MSSLMLQTSFVNPHFFYFSMLKQACDWACLCFVWNPAVMKGEVNSRDGTGVQHWDIPMVWETNPGLRHVAFPLRMRVW